MNKKTISMIAMISYIIFTVFYFINGLLGIAISYNFYSLGFLLLSILIFLLRATFNVFLILFFRLNYMEQDDRKISLFAGISAFAVAFFHLIWAVSWSWSYLIGYYTVLCFIVFGIFFIFNYSGKSKKIISLVLAVMSGILFIIRFIETIQGISSFYGNTLYLILNTLQNLSNLFSIIMVTVFLIAIYMSYPKVDNDKEENLSIGDWMLMMLLTAIPIVGLVMLFIWAFESNPHPIKSNWAKANLIWGLIMMISSLFIVLLVVLIYMT